MKTLRIPSRVALFVTATVLVLQISAVGASGDEEKGGGNHHRRVEITYTKWISAYPLMAGYTGGDVPGVFSGEVFQRQVSINGHVIRLEAMYEVQAEDADHSFTALIRGGTNGQTGAALLDGVILAGWRTGARVHVKFQTTTNCAGAPPGTCFQGTITIERADDDVDD